MLGIRQLVEDDLDRQTLNDLHVVSSRVLRWQQCEARAGAGLEAVNMAPDNSIGISVHFYPDWLPGAHAVELCLLEVRHHPHLSGDQDEQLLTRLQKRTLLDRLPRNPPVLRCVDFRI